MSTGVAAQRAPQRPSGKEQTLSRAASHYASTTEGESRAEATVQMSRRRAVCDCRVKADCAALRWLRTAGPALVVCRITCGWSPWARRCSVCGWCGDPCGLAKAELNLGEQFSRRRSSPFTPLHREDRFHISAAGSVHLHASRLPISQTRLLKFSPGAPVTTLFTANR